MIHSGSLQQWCIPVEALYKMFGLHLGSIANCICSVCLCDCLSVCVHRSRSGDGDDGPWYVPESSTSTVRAGRRRLPGDECDSHQTRTRAISAQLVYLRVYWRAGQGLQTHRARLESYTAETEPGETPDSPQTFHSVLTLDFNRDVNN